MEFFTFAWINDPQIWLSLLTLTALEIVLGIDNLVFIAILISGGLFLLYKATAEIGEMVDGEEGETTPTQGVAGVTFRGVVLQIAVIDIIFSLDSVITAVGMADTLWVMVAAVVVAMIIMVIASTPLANFVSAHPTVKMLALSFLLMEVLSPNEQ